MNAKVVIGSLICALFNKLLMAVQTSVCSGQGSQSFIQKQQLLQMKRNPISLSSDGSPTECLLIRERPQFEMVMLMR